MSGRSRQHAACRSLETALCGPGRSILEHLLSVHHRHAKTRTGMILACWRPRRRPRGGWGSNVQWRHLSRWTTRGAQHAPVAWPTFTFSRPLPARCWAPTYVLLFQATWAPSNRTNNVQSRELPSRWTAVGPARPRREAPIHFWPHSAARFEFSPRAHAGPEAAVVDDEGVGLPCELIRPSCCHPLPRSSPCGPWSLFLRPRPA
jgi:hypothetical protein